MDHSAAWRAGAADTAPVSSSRCLWWPEAGRQQVSSSVSAHGRKQRTLPSNPQPATLPGLPAAATASCSCSLLLGGGRRHKPQRGCLESPFVPPPALAPCIQPRRHPNLILRFSHNLVALPPAMAADQIVRKLFAIIRPHTKQSGPYETVAAPGGWCASLKLPALAPAAVMGTAARTFSASGPTQVRGCAPGLHSQPCSCTGPQTLTCLQHTAPCRRRRSRRWRSSCCSTWRPAARCRPAGRSGRPTGWTQQVQQQQQQDVSRGRAAGEAGLLAAWAAGPAV